MATKWIVSLGFETRIRLFCHSRYNIYDLYASNEINLMLWYIHWPVTFEWMRIKIQVSCNSCACNCLVLERILLCAIKQLCVSQDNKYKTYVNKHIFFCHWNIQIFFFTIMNKIFLYVTCLKMQSHKQNHTRHSWLILFLEKICQINKVYKRFEVKLESMVEE